MIQNRFITVIAAVLLMLAVSINLSFAEDAPPEIHDLAKTKLAEYGRDPIIVAAVTRFGAR